MISANKKLLDLAVKAYEEGKLDKADRFAFSRDRKRFENQELTFRELLEAIRTPTGDLKVAMKSHYEDSVYKRTFK